MQIQRFGPHAAAAIVGAFLLAPPSCTPQPKAEPESSVASSAWNLLPHPAFAKAEPKAAASIADIAERVTPSVVSIRATKVTKLPTGMQNPLFRHFFGPGGQGGPSEQRQQGMGSGVVVNADGTVLTNHHVIEGAEDIKVQTADKREFEAEVVGSDAKSDLAVLKLKGKISGLKPLKFGNSSQLRLGDVVLAVGNPFGVGQTITMGIVSAKGRADVGIVDYEDFIQTDAAINPGNSGGALVNMRGELVGINTAILSRSGGYQGIGFAIPTNMVQPIMNSLVKDGKVVRGWLGINIQDIDQELAKGLNLKSSKGVLVADVQAGSPAAKAGLVRGDVVLSVDGETTDSTGRLRNSVASAGANKTVKLEIVRGGKQQTISVKLGQLPDQDGKSQSQPSSEGLSGLTLEGLTEANRGKFQVPGQVRQGVVVTGVAPNAAAGRVLRPGDVIVELNRKPVSDLTSFERAYNKAKGTLLLLVVRQGNTLFLTLPKG